MAFPFHRALPLFLWAVAVLFVILSQIYMVRAGCTGDMKGGTFGDPAKALDIEAIGGLFAFIGLASAAIAPLTYSQFKMKKRIAVGAAILIFGFIGLEILGIQLEIYGVQRCTPT